LKGIKHRVNEFRRSRMSQNNDYKVKTIRPMWEMEREAIRKALTDSKGKVEIAAKALQIGRATLYRKIKKYNIEVSI
jgi:transcriptional regulator of acetoin/glycerol metabolism